MNHLPDYLRDGLAQLAAACHGQPYENQVFTFHPPCTCGQADCPWCVECTCDDRAYHYFVNGQEVNQAAYKFTARARFQRAQRSKDPTAMDRLGEGMNITHRPHCSFCKQGPQKQGGSPGRRAPNLWFKPWQVRVYWDGKRFGMFVGSEQIAPDLFPTHRWERLVKECLESKGSGTNGT